MYSFPNMKWSIPCPVLTVASCPAYQFLRRQVVWSGIPIWLRIFQFVVIHPVKGFSIVSEAEVDVLEFPCFFYDPAYVGNLISGSSAFSKSGLYTWKFLIHIYMHIHNFNICMGLSRQEYWSGLPFPSPWNLSNPGIEPVSPAWQAYSLPVSHQGSTCIISDVCNIYGVCLSFCLCGPSHMVTCE